MKKNKNVMSKDNYESTLFFKNKTISSMKKILVLWITCLFIVPINGQINKKEAIQNLLKQKIPRQNFEPREISLKEALNNKAELNLNENDELIEFSKKTNKNGIVYNKIKHKHNGIYVEGSILIAIEGNNKLKMKTKFVPGLNLNTKPTLSEQEALTFALPSMNIKIPSWEKQAYEYLLKKIKNDPMATNYPKGELVIYDNNYSQVAENYRLAYKYQVFSIEPLSNKTVYVDAHTGIILGSIEKMHNCNETCDIKPATGATNYSGNVSFEVCTEDGNYFLNIPGIQVYNSAGKADFPQNCIESANDIFEEDPTANEVYWAMQQYHDYLLNTFNRKSIDGEDHALVAFVHYGEHINNAYWNGSFALFGNGDGKIFNSLTSLDIVAHEFTHGLIDHTAQLIYNKEPGALNESFADIFGILLEYYTSGETDWQIGNHITLQHASLRNFVNPKAPNQYNGPYPNTYKGDNWYVGDFDNGGVHINSSVQNHWFYLLSEGGSGINDNGDDYTIEGIGIEKAAEIAYLNLTRYLTETSDFMDAREGAVQAAKDIFGEDSFEAEQTSLAWCAVGVGSCSNCHIDDWTALKAIYESTNGDNWTNREGWDVIIANQSSPPADCNLGDLYGVTLDENGRVKNKFVKELNIFKSCA